NLDLVMAFSARDFAMVGDLPAAVFPRQPFVFVSVNELDVPNDIKRAKVTGIVQRFDVRGTMELIFRLQPETRRVIVIGGVTKADQLTLRRVEEVTRSLPAAIQFEFRTNQPISELRTAVSSLPEDTVIFLGEVQRDIDGHHFYTSHVARILASEAN